MDERACISTANSLIKLCDIPLPTVCCIKDINSRLIISLSEKICGIQVPGLAFKIENFIPETDSIYKAHNIQAVIDSLSLDFLGISLSHITGEDIVAGNVNSISNLLEVLNAVVVYILPELELESEATNNSLKNQDHQSDNVNDIDQQKPCQETDVGIQKVKNIYASAPSSYESSVLSPNQIQYDVASYFAEVGMRDSKTSKSASKCVSDVQSTSEITHHSQSCAESFARDSLDTFKPMDFRSNDGKTDTSGEAMVNQIIAQEQNDGIQSEMEECEQRSKKEPIHQVFNHLKPSKASGAVALKIPLRKRKISRQKDEISNLYEKNFEDKLRTILQKDVHKPVAAQLKRAHLHTLKRPYRSPTPTPCKKSFLLPYNLRRRCLSRTSPKRRSSFTHPSKETRDKIAVTSDKKDDVKLNDVETKFVKDIQEEFPSIQFSPHTVRSMTDKYKHLLVTSHKQLGNALRRKSRTQVQYEEVKTRQSILANIMQKEMQQNQHLRTLREQKECERRVKCDMHEARMSSARTRKYFDEFHRQMQRKLQRPNDKEQMIVKDAIEEVMNMQKQQIRYLMRDLNEAEREEARQHKMYYDALENFYQEQFSMLTESLAGERKDLEEHSRAQKRVIQAMKRDLQETMKSEVRTLQENVLKDLQDTHFRQLDANNYVETARDRFRPR